MSQINQSSLNVSVDQAAAYLAHRAVDARAKRASVRTKRADPAAWAQSGLDTASKGVHDYLVQPALQSAGIPQAAEQTMKHIGWGLGGAALGGVAGAASQMFAPKKKRRTLSSMITGGLLGAGAGAGGSLLHSNWDAIKGLGSTNTQEKDRARSEYQAQQASARKGMGTTNPISEAAGETWGQEPGHIQALSRRAATSGYDFAVKDHLEQAKKYRWKFKAPSSLKPETAKGLVPVSPEELAKHYGGKVPENAEQFYRFDQQKDEHLAEVMRGMVDSGSAAGLDTPHGRRVNDITNREGIGKFDFGVGGVTGYGRYKPKGIWQELDRARSSAGGALTPEKYDLLKKTLSRHGITPTEAMDAHYTNSGDDLAKLILAQKRTRDVGGTPTPWDEASLQKELPLILQSAAQDAGDVPATGIGGWMRDNLTTGNAYRDALVPIAAADAAGYIRNHLRGGNPSHILRAIQEGKLPANIAQNEQLMAYLNHAADDGERGIANILKDPEYYYKPEAGAKQFKQPELSGQQISRQAETAGQEALKRRPAPVANTVAPAQTAESALANLQQRAGAQLRPTDLTELETTLAKIDKIRDPLARAAERQKFVAEVEKAFPAPPTATPVAPPPTPAEMAAEMRGNTSSGKGGPSAKPTPNAYAGYTQKELELLLADANANPDKMFKLKNGRVVASRDVTKALSASGKQLGRVPGLLGTATRPIGGGGLKGGWMGKTPASLLYMLGLGAAEYGLGRGKPDLSQFADMEARRQRALEAEGK